MAQTEQKNEYRSERKDRLAKSAKKKNKKNFDATGVVRAVLIVICVVALLAAVGGTLYAYGVPQKLMPAVKVEDRTYSVAEYSYYYTSVYQTYANQSYSTYEQYGFTLGFDYSKDPAAQTTTDDDGNTITYDEYFRNYVTDTLETYNYYLKLIDEEGMELSEENQTSIDETISELASYASTYGYSTSRYISVLYGKGLNEKKLRSLLEEQYLVSQYIEQQSEDEAASITTEQIEAAYAENPSDYQVVDLRLFGLEITDTETTETTEDTDAAEDASSTDGAAEEVKSAQELLCEEMCNKVTDETSFIKLAEEYCADEDKETFKDETATLAIGISKSTVESNIDADLAEWLFSADRKVGDKTTVATDEYAYVIYMKETAYREESPLVSARHILVSFDAVEAELEASSTDGTAAVTDADVANIDTENSEYSAEVILEAYKQAKAILAEYEEGEKTEDAFAALAEEYSDDTSSLSSDDEDSTSTSEGGLYEDIKKGNMVAEFENWVYDSSRQPGDTGIIQSTYGFHVMYFVSAHDEAAWVETIRESLASDLETTREDDIKAKVADTATPAMFEDFAVSQALKLINKLYISG